MLTSLGIFLRKLRLEQGEVLKDMADKVVYIKSGKIETVEVNAKPLSIEEIEW